MLRTKLGSEYLKRTIRPLYGWTQATPVHVTLDPAWDRSVNIWPGMAMKMNGFNQVTLVGTSQTDQVFGLSALYIGGDSIDEVLDQGVNAMAVWVFGGPDAQFEILAPAFDNTATYNVGDLLYAYISGANRGKLVNGSGGTIGTKPLAKVIGVNSANKLTIGGLEGTV